MKVAIADDDPIVCSSISTILVQLAHAAILWTANDGVGAVTCYAKQRPDVLLMDVQMPHMSGLEAATSILSNDAHAKILFLTTFADKQYIEQALAIGGRGYLIKQDVAAIVPAVQTVLSSGIVLGSEALSHLSIGTDDATQNVGNHVASRQADQSRSNPFANLTNREQRISALIAEGLDNRDIAQQLYLSEGTVRNRISDILAKLNLNNRTQLAIRWLHSQPR
ncbi:response regulator [Bifidobacterium aquikefiricola]|uniref:Response regulator transcription factor n=1 Tax=Bifidobacterium aquikefiricola TaxID=3059038 RepID=A0AB39U8K9_9BIFI